MRIPSTAAWSGVLTFVIFLAGCATPSSETPPEGGTAAPGRQPAERMEADVAYEIDVLEADDDRIEIGVEVQRPTAAITMFEINERWGGLSNVPSLVEDVRATDHNGRELDIERLEDNQWQVRHPRGARIRFSYQLTGTRPEGQTSGTSLMFVPSIGADRVFFVGAAGLMRPMHLEGGRPLTVEYSWKNLPDGWEAVTSHSTDESTSVQIPKHKMRAILLYAGKDLRVMQRDVKGNNVYFALTGDWKFDDDRLADFTADIVEAERSFFRDHSQDFYMVTVLPLDLEGTAFEGSRFTSGTGLHQSLATFLDAETPMETEKRPELKRLLAHEIFHNWNGSELVRVPDTPETVNWFTEGFTDYFARRILFDQDLITRRQYLWELNRQLVDYQTNPHRTVANAELARRYWEDPEIRRLAYDRGGVIALALNEAIRKHTDGTHDLRVVMQYLYNSDPRRGGHPNDRILKVMERYTSPEVVEQIESYVRDGEMVEVTSDLLGPCYRVTQRRVEVENWGFAVNKSLSGGQMREVVAGGPAARAGLEEGVPIDSIQKIRTREGLKMEVTVGDGADTDKVTVAAQVERRPVDVFEYDESRCKKARSTAEGRGGSQR